MRLYLDIDGVITSDPKYVEGIETFVVHDDEFTVGEAAFVDWHPQRFRQLVGRFDEVVWATSWCCAPDDLTELEDVIGVKYDRIELPLVQYMTERSRTTCGKRSAVAEHYHADPTPFVWIDDHIGAQDKAWARSVGGRTVVPSYETGGAYTMFDEIDEAIRQLRFKL